MVLAAGQQDLDPDTVERWTDRSDVEVLDFKNEKHRERLKIRGPGAPPLVIKNGLTKSANKKHGSLVELAKFGRLKVVKGLLKSNGATMGGVQMNKKSNLFSYWDKSILWLGKDDMTNHKNQHAWHQWRFNNEMPVDKFFRAFGKNSTPHLYWKQDIPNDVIGINPRPALCKRVAMRAYEKVCAEEPGEGTMWLNSAGQIASAHFDREFVIFLQLKGRKRWTFFAPTQLGDLCLYPYVHPALRQLQANLGNGVGAGLTGIGKACPRSAGVHNRSITVEPGDMLIVGPYHVHRVEAMEDSISYSFPFDSQEKRTHSLVGDTLYENVVTTVLQFLANDSRGRRTGTGVGHATDVAATSFRFLLREILHLLFKSKANADAFLALHWTDFESLPDYAQLASSKKNVQDLCKDENKHLTKARKQVRKQHDDLVVSLIRATCTGGAAGPQLNLRFPCTTANLTLYS